jgi:succinoglycan biosynthesis protein ExoM
MNKISICVCTRNRQEGVKRLLESFENMQVNSDLDVKIIIVENDQVNYSEEIINEFSKNSKYQINYYLETRQGLVYARNRSVKEAGNCDFCCFTDDDEVVAPDWLLELIKCQKEFNADAVTGPTYPTFTKELPPYISDFHIPKTYLYGTIVKTAYTGCLLIKKKYLDMIEGPFDTRLNFTGGEDIHMTHIVSDMGGVIRYNPRAETFENFPESRENIKYIVQRTYRNSNTGLYARSLINKNHFLIKVVPRLTMRFCYGLLLVIPLYIIGGKNKLKGLIKIVNALGGFHFLLGRQNKFYK